MPQVGKGRQLAGTILENFLHGRRKHVWISVGNDLALDARRDLDDLGCGDPEDPSNDSECAEDYEGSFEEDSADEESSESEEEFEKATQSRTGRRHGRQRSASGGTDSGAKKRSQRDGQGRKVGKSMLACGVALHLWRFACVRLLQQGRSLHMCQE